MVRGHSQGLRVYPGVRVMIFLQRLSIFVLLIPCCVPLASAQSEPADNPQRPEVRQTRATCPDALREDDLFSMPVPRSLLEEDACAPANELLAKISLNLPRRTPLRIALDQPTRVDHPAEIVHGRCVEMAFAFDQSAVPAAMMVSGRIASITPVTGVKRTLAYA